MKYPSGDRVAKAGFISESLGGTTLGRARRRFQGLVRILGLASLAGALVAGLQPTWGAQVGSFQPSALLKVLDRDGDGKLSREETPPLFRQQFERWDRNSDGFLEAAELEEIRPQRPASPQRGPVLPATVEGVWDIPYADSQEPRQRLDLLLPRERKGKLPIIAAIHGGGWIGGDKRAVVGRMATFAATGKYAVASIGYRLSSQATWPAQIHDCKAAIRWIRANAEQYGLDPDRIGVIGWSAGGHLAAMLGTTGDITDLEGDLGPHRDQKTAVQCVVDFFGPSELRLVWGDNGEGAGRPSVLVERLLGGPVRERLDVARSASPVAFVSPDDPPFLIVHGTEDPVVPYKQSVWLRDRLRKAGVPVALVTVEGGGHGPFRNPKVDELVAQFFATHLLGEKHEFSDMTIADNPTN